MADARNAAARITAENYELHLAAMIAAVAVFGVVLGAMAVSLVAHRKAAARSTGPFHRSALAEIAWNAIPWVILLGTAWPAARIVAELGRSESADITIKATGLQWKWGYEYVEGDGRGIAFYSNVVAPRRPAADVSGGYSLDVDNQVVVPVGKKVRVVLVANDDIHSWHVPALGVKQYAVPGLVRETWFRARMAGTYRGLCSIEACGAGRACVLIVVKAVSEGEYRRWVAGRRGDLVAAAAP